MPRKSKPVEESSSAELPALAISPEKVCFVIIKAKEFDAKDIVTEPDTGSNPSDDKMIAVLEDHGDDPVVEELTSFISGMNEDEQIDLVALAWLGRDDNTIDDWKTLREEATRADSIRRHAHSEISARHAARQRLSRGGAVTFRLSWEDFEINRL